MALFKVFLLQTLSSELEENKTNDIEENCLNGVCIHISTHENMSRTVCKTIGIKFCHIKLEFDSLKVDCDIVKCCPNVLLFSYQV